MSNRLLLFEVGSRRYAVDFTSAVEVLDEQHDPYPLPLTPPWLCGVIPFQGNLVPVLDLALYHGETSGKPGGYLVFDRTVNLALRLEGEVRVVATDLPEAAEQGETDIVAAEITLPEGESALLLVPERVASRLEELLAESRRR